MQSMKHQNSKTLSLRYSSHLMSIDSLFGNCDLKDIYLVRII